MRKLTPACWRTLEAIMLLHQKRGRVTVRAIIKALGTNSLGGTSEVMATLREHGLIDYENQRHGTCVPRVRFIAAEYLENES